MANPRPRHADRLLETLRRTIVVWDHREYAELTMRQLAVFLVCYLESEPQTVRGLAGKLNLHRPGITRALDRLEEAGLIRREVDPNDRRSVLTARTGAGEVVFRDLGQTLADAAKAAERHREPAARGFPLREGTVRKTRPPRPDLTTRQAKVFLTCYSESAQQTVRGLAAKLGMAKGTICRILSRLERFRLVIRQPDPCDARSVLIARTSAGDVFFQELQETTVGSEAFDHGIVPTRQPEEAAPGSSHDTVSP